MKTKARTLKQIFQNPKPLKAIKVSKKVRKIFQNPYQSAIDNLPPGYRED